MPAKLEKKNAKCLGYPQFFLLGFCLVLEIQARVWFSSD
jgi:hypothetical protein